MKIEFQGLAITEVPGVKEIRVEPDASSEHGTHIVLTLHDGDEIEFSLAQFGQFVDACSQAYDHGKWITDKNNADKG